MSFRFAPRHLLALGLLVAAVPMGTVSAQGATGDRPTTLPAQDPTARLREVLPASALLSGVRVAQAGLVDAERHLYSLQSRNKLRERRP